MPEGKGDDEGDDRCIDRVAVGVGSLVRVGIAEEVPNPRKGVVVRVKVETAEGDTVTTEESVPIFGLIVDVTVEEKVRVPISAFVINDVTLGEPLVEGLEDAHDAVAVKVDCTEEEDDGEFVENRLLADTDRVDRGEFDDIEEIVKVAVDIDDIVIPIDALESKLVLVGEGAGDCVVEAVELGEFDDDTLAVDDFDDIPDTDDVGDVV